MASLPPTAQEQSNRNGAPTSPPRQWLWDFPLGTEKTSDGCKADGVTKVRVVEYWSYEDGDPVRQVEGYEQDQIARRLKRPIPLRDSKPPSTGLQIAVVLCYKRVLPPLGISVLNEMNEALGLPNYHHLYSSTVYGAVSIFSLPDNNWVFVRPRSSTFSSIATIFRYNSQTNITRGIIYGNMQVPELELISEFEQCPHPLLLPLLALEVTLSDSVNNLARNALTMFQMEQATGYGTKGNGEDDVSVVDYRAMVKSLSQARSGTYVTLSTLRLSHTCAGYILKKLPFVDDRLSPAVQGSLRGCSNRLRERAEYTMSAIEHAMESGYKDRLDGHQATLFNLITQNDSLLSTSIARDSRAIAAASKRDSSSMKIIAVLTTFFLPGTFLATFFSMPLFDWDTESIKHVANKHFWIFWAVTAPLTMTITAGVASWAFWHSRNTRTMDLRERENFSQVVADEAQGLKRAATMTAAGSSDSIV